MSLPDIRRAAGLTGFGWDPWREFDDVFQRMGRIIGQVIGDQSRSGLASAFTGSWSPRVDTEEDGESFLVEIEVPGVRAEDLQVEIEEGRLRVQGSVNESEHKDHQHRTTHRSGSFDYQLALPAGIDPDQVQAGLDEGLLTVRVPKSTTARRRQIPVGGSSSADEGSAPEANV